MRRTRVALFCLILVIGTNGASLPLPKSIDENAIQLAQLAEDFWSLKPAVLLKQKPLAICPLIDECCGAEDRLQAITLLLSPVASGHNISQIMSPCIHSTGLHESYKLCPVMEKFISLPEVEEDNPVLQPFFNIISKEDNDFSKLTHIIQEYCDDYELHAFLCLSSKDLLQSCTRKILQQVHADYGYEGYEEFMIQSTQALINLKQEFSQFSSNNTSVQ